jgi:flagellar motor switch protein FliG
VLNPEIRKAAVLLMSLPREVAGQLMAKLTPTQCELVSAEMAKIDILGGDEQEVAINDFAAACRGSMIEEKHFSSLHEADSQTLLALISDEHPQTIALILSYLPPAQAAEIIGGLSSDRKLDVSHRIATLGRINREIIHDVEQGLCDKIRLCRTAA